MLRELYEWLAEIRATVGGNVSEVMFDFATLDQQVPFSLDSFPKTYVEGWSDVAAFSSTFDPAARGYLRIDTPNYWRDDVPALENLSYAAVLRPQVYDALPPSHRQAVAVRVRRIVSALEANYLRKTIPPPTDLRSPGDDGVLYVSSERDWEEIVDLTRRSSTRLQGRWERAASRARDELYETQRRGRESGRLVNGKPFEDLLGRAGPEDADTPADRLEFGEDLESDDTYAFLCAYDLCFPRQELTAKEWTDVVDKCCFRSGGSAGGCSRCGRSSGCGTRSPRRTGRCRF